MGPTFSVHALQFAKETENANFDTNTNVNFTIIISNIETSVILNAVLLEASDRLNHITKYIRVHV